MPDLGGHPQVAAFIGAKTVQGLPTCDRLGSAARKRSGSEDVMSMETSAKTTGITGADEFVARARRLGLNVEVKSVVTEAVTGRNDDVILPALLSVSVSVTLPVPEQLDGSYLAMAERCTSLTSYWSKKDKPRARGRWVLANYSYLGGHEDMHVMRRMHVRMDMMADNLKRLQRLAQD